MDMLTNFLRWILGKRIYRGDGFTVDLWSKYHGLMYEDKSVRVWFGGEIFVNHEGRFSYRGIYINDPEVIRPEGDLLTSEQLKDIAESIREAVIATRTDIKLLE